MPDAIPVTTQPWECTNSCNPSARTHAIIHTPQLLTSASFLCPIWAIEQFCPTYMPCLWIVGETGAPGGNPRRHRENMQTPHRKASLLSRDSIQGPSYCEATVLPTEPPWALSVSDWINFPSNTIYLMSTIIHVSEIPNTFLWLTVDRFTGSRVWKLNPPAGHIGCVWTPALPPASLL